MPLTQAERLIAIATPLEFDALLLQSFEGHEGISRLFHFDAELVSEDPAVAFDALVGQAVTIRVRMRDQAERFFHGHVSRFTQTSRDVRLTSYRAHIVPWLWFLTRTADCRIFQNLSVPDILAKIFNDLGFADFRDDLQRVYDPLDYCVQYRETDFDFVSRLMEQHGIVYYFEHEESKHTLVLADAADAHPPCPDQETARCELGGGALEFEDVITSCQFEQELRPGKYTLTDYNFETPSTSLEASVGSVVAVGGNSRFEVYDFPGEYAKKPEGEKLVKLRIEAEEATNVVLSGASTCRAFTSGYRFDLEEHYRADLNQAYLLLEVRHAASVGAFYSSGGGAAAESEQYGNTFTAIPHSVPFRAPRVTPRPIVRGTQTAVVVGPSGEEIHTDKFGRVKVQFHWDREGKRDENSSCWIRVSQPWAGKGWGSVTIPRIGQEVIVDFLEGDPDRPIIVGRVYNAELMPPYGLPAAGVVSGGKSKTHKGSGYNEMSMDDTAGKEKITIHGQYDMATTVEHDQTTTVHNNRTDTVDVNDTESVGVDQSLSVGSNQTLKVGANQTVTVGANQNETVGANATRSVGANETHSIAVAHTLSVGAAQAISVGAAQALTVGAAQSIGVGGAQSVSVGGAQSTKIGGGQTIDVGSGQTVGIGGTQSTSAANVGLKSKGKINNEAGSDYVIDAGSSILIKCGGAEIVMKGGKITIKGTKISIKGSGGVKVEGSKIGNN